MTTPNFLWYQSRQTLKLGDVCRYTIKYTTTDPPHEMYVRIKNLENTSLRAVNLFNGPIVLYCHVVPCQFNHLRRYVAQDPTHNREVCFRNTVKPGQTFNVRLVLNDNSLLAHNANGSRTYQWECQVMSQIVINTHLTLTFLMMVGSELENMQRISRSVLTSLTKGDFAPPDHEHDRHEWGKLYRRGLDVVLEQTDDLWPPAPTQSDKPVHLVIVTHGIFSNLTADMLYLRDRLMATTTENLVVDGFRGNAGHTEKGIHRLGVGVSNFVAQRIAQLEKAGGVESISFVGHSLGGPVQLYALKHLLLVHGTDYFSRRHIRLRHFVCLASPMLGVLSEMSLWILWFLDLGTLGKTGRDLTLLKKLPHYVRHLGQPKRDSFRPLLETLPDEPVQTLLRSFELRTVYANAVNDGIVPLRTSALLYLDWEALGDVTAIQKQEANTDAGLTGVVPTENDGGSQHAPGKLPEATNASGHELGEVPAEEPANMKKYNNFLASAFGNDNSEQGNGESDSPKLSKNKLRRFRKYALISAKGSDTLELDSEASEDGRNGTLLSLESGRPLHIPPKASTVESALNSLLCPIPSENYITNPESRTPVIFHDKYYHFNNIPAHENTRTKGIKKLFRYTDWKIEKQAIIAQKYHARDLSWRKVLVYLPPDAHNNIVVRRRFANGYGWGVIDHLTGEIFGTQIKAKM